MLRNRIVRAERALGKNKLAIPQPDGSVRKFEQEDYLEAFAAAFDRWGGEDVEEHPMEVAARNSPHPSWNTNFIAIAHTFSGSNNEGAEED